MFLSSAIVQIQLYGCHRQPEQAFRIMMELKDPQRTQVFLAAVTGLRISEALGLKWGDLDYARYGEGYGISFTLFFFLVNLGKDVKTIQDLLCHANAMCHKLFGSQ
jgi:integrase